MRQRQEAAVTPPPPVVATLLPHPKGSPTPPTGVGVNGRPRGGSLQLPPGYTGRTMYSTRSPGGFVTLATPTPIVVPPSPGQVGFGLLDDSVVLAAQVPRAHESTGNGQALSPSLRQQHRVVRPAIPQRRNLENQSPISRTQHTAIVGAGAGFLDLRGNVWNMPVQVPMTLATPSSHTPRCPSPASTPPTTTRELFGSNTSASKQTPPGSPIAAKRCVGSSLPRSAVNPHVSGRDGAEKMKQVIQELEHRCAFLEKQCNSLEQCTELAHARAQRPRK